MRIIDRLRRERKPGRRVLVELTMIEDVPVMHFPAGTSQFAIRLASLWVERVQEMARADERQGRRGH